MPLTDCPMIAADDKQPKQFLLCSDDGDAIRLSKLRWHFLMDIWRDSLKDVLIEKVAYGDLNLRD